jgi:hypothetical protein
MSGDSSVNWDEELQNYYKQLMQGNSDFKEENREGDWWDKTKSIFTDGVCLADYYCCSHKFVVS